MRMLVVANVALVLLGGTAYGQSGLPALREELADEIADRVAGDAAEAAARAEADAALESRVAELEQNVGSALARIAALEEAIQGASGCALELRILDVAPGFAVSPVCFGPPPATPTLTRFEADFTATPVLRVAATGSPRTTVRPHVGAECAMPIAALVGIAPAAFDIELDASGVHDGALALPQALAPLLEQFTGAAFTARAFDRFGRESSCSAPIVLTVTR